MALKQAKRLLHLKAPLGDDLVLTGFHGFEGMSQLFQFELEMISDKADIKAKDVVAKPVTFCVRLADDSLRYFNGIVNRFVAGDEDENGRRDYRAEVVPWFWFLTRNADCRVFEDKSIQEIMEQIFSDRGFSDHNIKLSGTHPKRPYCVQYRETDFDFLCRLMEEEGVWYTFTHEDGKHTMLISDSKNDYFDCQQKEVDYPTDVGSLAMEDHIRSWEHRYEFRSGKIAHSDYNVLNDGGDNFLQPSTPMDTDSETVVDLKDNKKFQLYDYPGIYTAKQDGTDFADLRMEAEEVAHDVVEGSGIVRAFTPGGKFKIRQHRAKSEEGNKFVLLTLTHNAQETQGYETGDPVGEGYHNSFTCIPDQINFRPACTTPKPSVHGVQSAIVIGDDEIPVDKHGRVKVRFQWLRKGKSDPDQSCWVRVSQMWAGAEWGGMHIPHKDQEVLVAFIDGDPDRPVITGRVYNEEQKVPLPLPDHKTKSIIRDYGDNQMIWEGKADEQHIRIDQACGNELLMNAKSGQESVQLRDMFGNELFMDAAGKSISLYTPSHQSGLVLGKSSHLFSASHQTTSSWGNSLSTHVGAKMSAALGYKAIGTIGVGLDVFGGTKIAVGFAGGMECIWGTKLVYSSQGNVSRTEKSSTLQAKENVTIDADEEIHLLGGKDDKSQVWMDDTKLRISYKGGSKGRQSTSPPSKTAAGAYFLGTVATVGHSVYQATSNINGEYQHDPASVKDLSIGGVKLRNDVADIIDNHFATVVGVGWAAGSVINAVKEYVKSKAKAKKAQTNPADPHEAADGELLLDENGVSISAGVPTEFIAVIKDVGIVLDSEDNTIEIDAKKNINLKSSADITFDAKTSHFKSGELKHKNLHVMSG